MTSSWLYLSNFRLYFGMMIGGHRCSQGSTLGLHIDIFFYYLQSIFLSCTGQNFPCIKQTLGYTTELGRNDVVKWHPPGIPLAIKKGISSIPSSTPRKNINSPSCGSNPDMNTAETVGLMSWWNPGDQAQGSCNPDYMFCFTLYPCSSLKFFPFIALISSQ